MKITIDLDVLDNGKREWLLDTLNYTQTPFDEAVEEEWNAEEVIEHNREINESVAEFERGEFLTMEEVEAEILNRKNAKNSMEQAGLKTTVKGI